MPLELWMTLEDAYQQEQVVKKNSTSCCLWQGHELYSCEMQKKIETRVNIFSCFGIPLTAGNSTDSHQWVGGNKQEIERKIGHLDSNANDKMIAKWKVLFYIANTIYKLTDSFLYAALQENCNRFQMLSLFPNNTHCSLSSFEFIPPLLFRELRTSQSVFHWDTLFSIMKLKLCFDT